MAEIKEIVHFLEKEFDINEITDPSPNGIQVEGKQQIERVAFAVDLTLQTIKKAVENNCDMIISHHPLISEKVDYIKGLLAKKLELLIKNNISAFVLHYPLDVHKKLSHGKLIVDELGLYGIDKFGEENKLFFGFSGHLKNKMSIDDLKKLVDGKLKTNSQTFKYGKDEISSIAIISGSGGFALNEAVQKNIDCYLTGEMKYSGLLEAKDLGINVVLAGHYETEKLGIVKLSQLLTKKFKIQAFFVES